MMVRSLWQMPLWLTATHTSPGLGSANSKSSTISSGDAGSVSNAALIGRRPYFGLRAGIGSAELPNRHPPLPIPGSGHASKGPPRVVGPTRASTSDITRWAASTAAVGAAPARLDIR